MSTHDTGRGHRAGPTPELQSDFANRQSAGTAPQTWGANALSTQKSEVAFMVQGAGRPGQPIAGQRSIFGGNGPVFAQMPSYTPVTRGPAPQAPEPPQPSFSPYQASQPAPQTFQNPFASQPVQQPPQPAPAAAPSFANLQTASAQSYKTPDFQPQAYRGASQPTSAPSYSTPEHPGAQPYPGSSYNGAQGFSNQSYQPQSYPDASFGDASFPETGSQDAGYGETKFGEQSYGKQNYGDARFGDASFEDASFSDSNFAASNSPFSHLESSLDGGLAQHQHSEADHGFDTFSEEATQDYVMASQGNSGHVPPSDPRRQLQAFDALYDQPPQIALGSTEPSRRGGQDFFESERVDADFLDVGQVAPPPGARSKMATLKSRSAFMVGSALLGAIALGGALAFVYKQSGGGIGSEQPPLVTADARPVKELPDQPGGKEFPHKNKLIYDRLQNGDEPESERIVPRQEDVAVPALPPAPTETAGLPTPVATTDTVPPATPAVDNSGAPAGAAPTAVASADDTADGGPRRVKTLKVRPDGSVEDAPAAQASAAAADGDTAALPAAAQAPAPADAMPVPAAAAPAPAPAPQQVAAVQPAPVKPKVTKPAATQASATPAAAPAASASTKYVVQVGSKKNQTEALASFADMQQKYPSLLASYRPMVQKADLGTKGVWYRLRIGPIADKTAAAKLCSQLKAQGLPDCLVATQ
jgi:hypothetical protein